MYMNIAPHTLIFFYACLLGGALGVCYDIFRILRIAFVPGKIAIFIQDILFAAISLLSLFLFCQATTDGSIRFFVLIGATAGFALYYATIGVLIFKTATVIINAIKRLLTFLFRVFVSPFKKIFRFTYKLFRPFLSPVNRLIKKIYKKIKKLLRNSANSLYNRIKIKGKKNKRKNVKNKNAIRH